MSADLHEAIENDDMPKVKELSSKVNLNEKFDASVNPQHAGITPLALACALNKTEMTKTLLECGADVNVPFAALNTTALMTSSYHGHTDVVRLLLENKADVHAVDLQQSTALGYAFGGTRNLDVIELLLGSDINVNQKNMLGMSAFLLAAGYGNEKLVHMILQAGADPKATNDFGNNAIHIAVVGKQELLKKMRKHGSAEAAAADRSLNRRNLDVAIQEWARLHKDEVGAGKEDQESLAKVGRIMMSIGHQLDDSDADDGDEQERIQRRVQAVWKYRQDKLKSAKDRKKSSLWNLLTCAGGKSKRAEDHAEKAKPYAPLEAPPGEEPNKQQNKSEVAQLSERFARILRMLIDAGCEVDQIDKTFGLTPLDITMLNGDMESSAVLASAGADPNHLMKMLALKELYQAIVNNNRKEVKHLLTFDEDLDVNVPLSRFNLDSKSNDEGLTPLTLAAKQGDPEICKLLIRKGARINDVGPSGHLPLGEASAAGYKRVVEALLANNADVEVTSPARNSATPLAIAVANKQHAVADMLIKKGAKVDRRFADGKDPLMTAFENHDMEMAGLILEADLEQNFLHKDGLTAEMAKSYQSKERDVVAIQQRLSEAARGFEGDVLKPDEVPGAAMTPPKEQEAPVQLEQQQLQLAAGPPLPPGPVLLKAAPPMPQQPSPAQSPSGRITLAQQVESLIQPEQTRGGSGSFKDKMATHLDTARDNVESRVETTTEEIVDEAGNIKRTIVKKVETTTKEVSGTVEETKDTVVEKVQQTRMKITSPFTNSDGPPPVPTSLLPEDDEIDDEEHRTRSAVVKTVTTSVVKMAEVEDLDDEDSMNNNPDDAHNTTGASDMNENQVKDSGDDTNANKTTDNAEAAQKKAESTF